MREHVDLQVRLVLEHLGTFRTVDLRCRRQQQPFRRVVGRVVAAVGVGHGRPRDVDLRTVRDLGVDLFPVPGRGVPGGEHLAAGWTLKVGQFFEFVWKQSFNKTRIMGSNPRF